MAHAISLTDGTTTANLYNLSGTFATEWALETPDHSADSLAREEPIAEVINVLIQATSVANLQAAARTIEQLLQAAARRAATGLGARVFLTVQLDGEASQWRSEVYGGRLDLEQAPQQWGGLKIAGALGLTRAPWWEGPETELAISASGQGAATGGRTLTNNGTAAWWHVAAAQVQGSLPAPIRLQVTNTTGGNAAWREFYWGLNAFANPTTFGHILQGESQEAGYGTDVASGEASGGYVNRVTVNTTGTWRNGWLLPTTMTSAGGRWFRLVLRVLPNGSAISMRLRPALFDASGLNLLWQGNEVTWDGGLDLIDLGPIPVPPGQWGSDYGQVMLKVWSEVATSTYVFDLDYAALLPMDAWRRGTTPGMLYPNGDAAVVDDIEAAAYTLSGSTRYPYLMLGGEPLRLFPNTAQLMMQLVSNASAAGAVDDTYSVRVWYRPRRATI